MPWYLWALAGTGALVLLWRLYLIVVPEPVDLPPRTLTGTEPHVGADLGAWYAPLVGASVQDGNRIEHLRNGAEIFPAMLDAIDAARDSVHFLTYVYWTGDIAERCARALEEAAARGCEVRVVLDAAGAFKMDEALIERLRSADCRVEWFHPFGWYDLRRINHRTHRKILVVDGTVGFTGGVGIAEEWEGDARDESEWRDDHFRVTGPCVHRLQGAFAENWLNATGEFLAGERYYPRLERTGSARVVSVATARREDLAPVLVLYWLALRCAVERVDITTPYFLPDPPLLEAMREAAARGVRIRLLVPNDHNDSRLVRWTSLSLYQDLIEAGVEIHEFQPTMIHSKVMVIDERWSVMGSANYDNRSFDLNHEFVLLVDDPELNGVLSDSFDRDLERARHITEREFEKVPLLKRIVAKSGLLLREQL